MENFHAQKKGRYGKTTICKPCKKKESKIFNEKYKLLRPYNKLQHKDLKLKAAYGIDLKIYNEMLLEQKGKCAICGTESTGKRDYFHVDHCHKTLKVRGLLCSTCNSGIGGLKDDIELLKKAIEYLQITSLGIK